MKAGIQTMLLSAGNEACYFLSILELAERITGIPVDVVSEIWTAASRKEIDLNLKRLDDPNNFLVTDLAGLLSRLTGNQWSCTKESAGYELRRGEVEVLRYERITTGKTWAHFCLSDWDPLQSSQTVKCGKVAGKRIFRRKV
jgi:hypothetical protein